MPFNWRWLCLFALLNLKVRQFVVNPNLFPYQDYDVLPFPRTDSLPFSQPDGQFLRDNSILQEMESDGEGIRKPTALLAIGTGQINLEACLLADGCHASDHQLTGNPTSDEINEMKDSVSSPGYMNFTSILLQAERHIRTYSEMIRSMLPQEWQPGSVFHEGAKVLMSMTPALDMLAILFLIWTGLKSRTNQLITKQLLEDFNHRMDECLVKISALNKKVRKPKEKMRRSNRILCSSRYNQKPNASIRELEKRLEKMSKERDCLSLMLKESEDRLKNAHLEQETAKKTFQEKETALLQKLQQLEQDWRARLEKAVEDRSENEQRVKKEKQALPRKPLRTEKQHLIQMHDYEVADVESRQEKITNAGAEFLVAGRRMAMSQRTYQKRDMKKAS